MTTFIRPIEEHERPMLQSWWIEHGMMPPEGQMMPLESTYLMEIEDVPMLSVTIFWTNASVAWADNFVANPGVPAACRKKSTSTLLQFLESLSKTRGKDRLFCMGATESTKRRYEQLGFRRTLDDVATFIKEIH